MLFCQLKFKYESNLSFVEPYDFEIRLMSFDLLAFSISHFAYTKNMFIGYFNGDTPIRDSITFPIHWQKMQKKKIKIQMNKFTQFKSLITQLLH